MTTDTSTNWYGKLGLRPVINASATLTALGGSIMSQDVRDAMASAATQFIDLRKLQVKAASRIAGLSRNEAAYISSGAAGGITLSVAACMAGTDPGLINHFPGPDGFVRNELLMFRVQRNMYDYAARMTGVKLVELDSTIDSLGANITGHTAAVLWFAGTRLRGDVPPLEEIIPVAKAVGIPVIVDAAAQIPPVSSLWHFTQDLGADLVVFSGGKGLGGPQSSGIVLGRKELIDAVAANGSPNTAIGRPLKVGKEELIGCLAAVEAYVSLDEDAMLDRYEAIVQFWLAGLGDIPGTTLERGYPSEAGQPHARAIVRLQSDALLNRDQLHDALWEMNPRIAVWKEDNDGIALNPQTIQEGEERIVRDAIVSCLTPA